MLRVRNFLKTAFFFLLGATLTAIFLVAVGYLVFTSIYQNKIYPGVKVETANVTNLAFSFYNSVASISATSKELGLHLDTQLMDKRAMSVGRQTRNPYYNFSQIVAAWQGKITLPVEVGFDTSILDIKISAIAPLIEKQPVDAVYEFIPGAGPDKKGRVSAYKPSADGLRINREKIKEDIIAAAKKSQSLQDFLPTDIIPPAISSSTADKLGIKNLLGQGESYFYDSIPGRVYNIGLGTSKVNGSLIAPNEIFSFDQAIGTVSAVFGFQKAYSIIKGKTTLDDGGGVCQVSTTLYRAALNAGLPILERAAHAYRVGFYEQGGFLPGLDATVYPPSPDLKIKNDTGGWILIQTIFDTESKKLTFDLFGTSDGRKTTITGPIILSTTPPPDPIYEDDPISPIGQIRQVDSAHYGAKVYFKRLVTRGETTLIDETVFSDYIPWPARFLRGTKT